MTAVLIDQYAPTHPLDLINVNEVDDNGGVHIETQMTAGFLVELHKRGLLTFTGNIRPQHQRTAAGQMPTGKTGTKIRKWVSELLRNEAVLGNLSVRLDPTKSRYELFTDEETGLTTMRITEGVMDCKVDSLSRIKAIWEAAHAPLQTMNLGTRHQVRIWLLDDAEADKVATIYNTRGDKVNDSTAKYAYSETNTQEVARRLVNGSSHLGQLNVEIFSNSVSASSSKLTAYNTISKGMEVNWKGDPTSEADVEAQAAWLIKAWDALVAVRHEFGRMSTPARQEQRKRNIASSAVVIHGIIGALSTMFAERVDPAVAFQALALGPNGEDVFGWDNELWTNIGVVAPVGRAGSRGTRNGFPQRQSVAIALQDIMGLRHDPDPC